MTEIKICGITRLQDAMAAAVAGADAVGFILYPASPRFVKPQSVRRIVRALPEDMITVGVFVNEDAERVRDVVASCGLDMIQLHGDETPEYCRRFPKERLIKAVWPSEVTGGDVLSGYPVHALLADGRRGDRRGGTGCPADWRLAADLARRRPLVLAGGLRAENIRDALVLVRPRAVDINSGVETAPGIKDPERMKHIIALVRGVETPADGNATRIFRRYGSPVEDERALASVRERI